LFSGFGYLKAWKIISSNLALFNASPYPEIIEIEQGIKKSNDSREMIPHPGSRTDF